MAVRKTTTFGASMIALAATGWLVAAHAQAPTPSGTAATPAPSANMPADNGSSAPTEPTATPPKASGADSGAPSETKSGSEGRMHHRRHGHMSAKKSTGGTGDEAVEDLNARSLEAAKSGQPFNPAGGGAGAMPSTGSSGSTVGTGAGATGAGTASGSNSSGSMNSGGMK